MPENHSILYNSGYLWFAIAIAVLVAAAMQPKSRILRPFLSLPPLRWIGLISYGVYLWHVPLYWVLTEETAHFGGYLLFALGAPLAILIAGISYRFIETPIRKGAMPFWGKAPITARVGGVAVGMLLFLMTTGR
jgi:peptidoglycan/LPS O-acetylase OafA/YrhL